MPPSIQFTKETVLSEAFLILRSEGLEAVSARNIAKSLGSSTQPVYSAYASMEELRKELFAKAKEYATAFLIADAGESEPFLSIGMQYLRFARDERELFKLIFLSNIEDVDVTDPFSPPALIEHMRLDNHLSAFDDTTLKRLLSNMCIYTHGLAALAFRGKTIPGEAVLRERLYQMGGILIMHELDNVRGDSEKRINKTCTKTRVSHTRKGDK